MNALYVINYAIFAAFFTLLVIETGIALTSMFVYGRNRDRIRRYLMPIWEVNGTFGVFFLVNFEATYPTLLPLLGDMYVFPALLAVAFLLLRNAFISYSEYVGARANERRYMQVYVASTLIVVFLATSILTSSVSGIGVDLSGMSISIIGILFNPFNILIFIAMALFALFIISSDFDFYSSKRHALTGLALGIAIVLLAVWAYTPYIIENIYASPYLAVAFLVVLAVAVLAYIKRHRHSMQISAFWLFVSTIMFGLLEYPYRFGGVQNVNAYLATPTLGNMIVLLTAVFGSLLVAGLIIFVYVAYMKQEKAQY